MVRLARLTGAVAVVAALALAAGCSNPGEPVVSVPSALYGNVGVPVTIDASGSHDAAGGVVTFAWTVAAKPDGSAAALVDVSQGVVRLVADKEGAYTVHLVVSTAGKAASGDVAVTVWYPIHPLTFRPIDVEYDRPLDRIVAVSDQPPALHLYDAAAGKDVAIALPVAPTCVSVSPDGKAAAIGHDAQVTFVDLEAKTVLKTWATTGLAGDVVVTDPLTLADHTARVAYLYPQGNQWTMIHAIDASNGAEIGTDGFGAVYGGGRFKLQPGSSRLILIELGITPQQFYRGDFDPATGALTLAGKSDWTAHNMGSNFWISEDGLQILMEAGTRFRTSDMTYSDKLSLFSLLAWAEAPAAPSAAAGKWLVQPASDDYSVPADARSDNSLWTFDAQYLANPERTDLPKVGLGRAAYPLHGRYVFFDKAGTKRISIAQIDSDAGALNDFVVLTF
ncbi:MAG TPA: hypothetical protein VGK67_29935 [Myxococcales bacterium]|jgi:hypothetical protein